MYSSAIGVKNIGSRKKGEMSHADLKKKLKTANNNLKSTKADIRNFNAAIQQKVEEMEVSLSLHLSLLL